MTQKNFIDLMGFTINLTLYTHIYGNAVTSAGTIPINSKHEKPIDYFVNQGEQTICGIHHSHVKAITLVKIDLIGQQTNFEIKPTT